MGRSMTATVDEYFRDLGLFPSELTIVPTTCRWPALSLTIILLVQPISLKLCSVQLRSTLSPFYAENGSSNRLDPTIFCPDSYYHLDLKTLPPSDCIQSSYIPSVSHTEPSYLPMPVETIRRGTANARGWRCTHRITCLPGTWCRHKYRDHIRARAYTLCRADTATSTRVSPPLPHISNQKRTTERPPKKKKLYQECKQRQPQPRSRNTKGNYGDDESVTTPAYETKSTKILNRPLSAGSN